MASVGPGTADAIRVLVEEEFGPGYWDGFQAYMTEDLPWHEWRFMGLLGFGGKVNMSDRSLYVSCYPEDRNGLEADIVRVNAELAKLFSRAPRKERTDG